MYDLDADPVIAKLIALGESRDEIRAVLLTSSRTNPNLPLDVLSDYDVEISFDDPMPFAQSDEWVESLGPTMLIWHYEEGEGMSRDWTRMAFFEDGTKMDIGLRHIDALRDYAAEGSLNEDYDNGYIVLLDKDGVTKPMPRPNYRGYIVSPPTQARFAEQQATFWMDSTYVAKFLWRDDLIAAQWRLLGLVSGDIREMLEWLTGMKRGWNWKAGREGRGLKAELDPGLCREVMCCHIGTTEAELWDAFFRTTGIFRRIAIELADGLGFEYDHDLDSHITAYHHVLKALDRKATSPEELTRLLTQALACCHSSRCSE